MSYETEQLKNQVRNLDIKNAMLESDLRRCHQDAREAKDIAQNALNQQNNLNNSIGCLLRMLQDAFNSTQL